MPPRELGMRSIALIAMTCAAVVASDGRVAAAPFLAGPPEGDGPVVVRTTFALRDINDIDDERETFEFGGVLRFVWHDARQAFDPEAEGVDEKVYQGAYQFDEVFSGWFPQVVLVNESGSYEKLGVVLRVRPDGTLTLLETVNAVAEAELDLRRHPFDRQRLDATFEVLGFDEDEVVLRADPALDGPPAREIWLPQWTLERIGTSTRSRRTSYAGHPGVASSFVVSMDVRRQAFFMVRLVAVPLALIVMLSWTVFWMDRSSLGDRINVSFIGILTAVAYQIVVSELLPPISYVTLMNAFLNISFMLMCAAVVVNLVVGSLDQRGEIAAGDRIDRRSRWLFPLLYFGLVLLATGAAFLLL